MLRVKRTHAYDVNAVFEEKIFEFNGITLPYRIYIPKNYDCGERYPLVLFLHGAGERGTDNKSQLKIGIQKMFDYPDSPIYDSIIIAPQCPLDGKWVPTSWEDGNYSIESTPESVYLRAARGLIAKCKAEYNIDDDRVYVTGISMGGLGTWDLLSRYGSLFAAGVPVCGAGDPSYAKLLRRIPIRTYHGSEDTVVPTASTRKMFASIKREGGECIDYTELDGCGHHIWDIAYADRDMADWLFSQSRAERRLKAEKSAKIKRIAAGAAGGAAVLSILAGMALGKIKRK